jgi:tellurite resistance protein TerA
MGLFGGNKTKDEAPQQSAPPAQVVDLGKKTGTVSLEKGQKVSIEKTPLVTASVSWKSGTDYDVYALVRFRDGHSETVSMFGTKNHPDDWQQQVAGGAVRHQGDVGQGNSRHDKNKVEVVELRLNPTIEQVAIVAYSAQSNGTGSFYRFKVSMQIDNHDGTVVGIDAKHANNDDHVYTCVPGIVHNTDDGVVIEATELYSRRSSESRPAFDKSGQLVMDAGPENAYK